MNRQKWIVAIVLLFMSAFLAGCFTDDSPPSDDTPSPPAHNGVFSSDYGTMTFNGDGKTITIDFNEKFAEMTGIPAGKTECNYVFLFHNEKYRYDKAEYFRIIIGEKEYQFNNEFGTTNETVIVIREPETGDVVTFKKESK